MLKPPQEQIYVVNLSTTTSISGKLVPISKVNWYSYQIFLFFQKLPFGKYKNGKHIDLESKVLIFDFELINGMKVLY